MSKFSFNIIIIIVALIVLYVLAGQLVSDHKISSLSEFIASSSEMIASTTITNTQTDGSPVTNASSSSVLPLPTTTIYDTTGTIKAFVATSDVAREQGLSGVQELYPGTGELFVFDTPGNYGFWMKDMRFDLDLVWIDAEKKVAGVTHNALASSYPFVFMPPRQIKYVLEIQAGTAEQLGLKTGVTLNFSVDNSK